MNIDKYNYEILKTWESINLNNIPNEVKILWPGCYVNLSEKIELLFIGLNPSDSFPNIDLKDSNNAIFKTLKKESFKKTMTYNNQNYTLDELKELEHYSFYKHSYFTTFREIGNNITNNLFGENNMKYGHLDLYQFRLQDSKKFLKLKEHNYDFFEKQLNISFKLIQEIKPKIIFVANKNASLDLESKFSLGGKTWNDKFGCHVIKKENWTCSIFLSGMITQSRAIDKFSLERLIWHIKKVYNSNT